MTLSTHRSSRLIFLNLPPSTTPPSLTTYLASPPSLADCTQTDLKLIPKRRFAFVGYKDEHEATKVREWFDGSYWGGIKLKVDFVREDALSDNTKPAKRARLNPPEQGSNSTPLPPTAKVQAHDKRLQEFMDVMKGGEAGLPTVEGDSVFEDGVVAVEVVEPVEEQGGEDVDDAEWLRRRQQATIPDASSTNTAGPSQSHSTQLQTPEQQILLTSRLFIRNLSFLTTSSDLTTLLTPFGAITSIHLPQSKSPTPTPLGTALVEFSNGEDAVAAWRAVDGRSWMGRLVHVLPGQPRRGEDRVVGVEGGEGVGGKGVVDGKVLGKEEGRNVKAEIKGKQKEAGAKGLNWGTLYMNSDAVASSIAARLGIPKSSILASDTSLPASDTDDRLSTIGSAVKLALAESTIIAETKAYFTTHGVNLDRLTDESGRRIPRSKTVILVKNIPYGTTVAILSALFEPHGKLKRVLMPPAGTLAVVEFEEEVDAGRAFKAVAYRRLGNAVVYLEKGPEGLFEGAAAAGGMEGTGELGEAERAKKAVEGVEVDPEDGGKEGEGATLFIKNLAFATTTDRLTSVFSSLPSFSFARVSTKPDPKIANGRLSMGFGFLGFKTREAAQKALGGLGGFKLDGHDLEFKFAMRGEEGEKEAGKGKKGGKEAGKKTTKMIVKNVPFEASKKDIRDLFSSFGSLKSCRIPKKHNSTGRGFAFLDFTTRSEAETAMEALKHTHLLGRHLVLEWAAGDEEAMRDVEKLREKVKGQYRADLQGEGRKRGKLGVRDGEKRGEGEGEGMDMD